MPNRTAWAAAFVKQARSDWRVYQLLARSEHPDCHSLHYLQMACEKVAKAYRVRDLAGDVDQLVLHHVGFAPFVRAFLLSPAMKVEFKDQEARLHSVMSAMHSLAREIERLAPAVDSEARPDNSEYPWSAGTAIVAPCDYGYPNLSLLTAAKGRALLKLVCRAMDDFEGLHIQ